jgi:hypothetical protein
MGLSSRVDGRSKLQCGVSLLGHVRLICIHKSDGLHIAEANALRISVTIVALHGDPILYIKERMPERTCDDAGPASDAQILVDGDPIIILRLPVASLRRANLHTIGFFTVIAGHRKVYPDILPLDDFDPRTARIARPRVKYRAHQLAQTASRALLLIDDQYLLVHSLLLLFNEIVNREL